MDNIKQDFDSSVNLPRGNQSLNQKKEGQFLSKNIQTEEGKLPFFLMKYKLNEATGVEEFDTIETSDGSRLDKELFKQILKRTTGTSDPVVGDKIVQHIARGLASDKQSVRDNTVVALLPALKPQDATEALLLGQFLTLQDAGMNCLQHAHIQEKFNLEERLLGLAVKLFAQANASMQTLMKYRSGGQQTVQVIHIHDRGQAVIAQNLSQAGGGGGVVNSKIEPHG